MKWLSSELKKEISIVFEARYNKSLSDDDVIEIAENLTKGMETILKSNE